jgi:hypothetical protein
MCIYIIGNDGITLCREPPAAVNEGEIAVASSEELNAARLSGKRLLALCQRRQRSQRFARMTACLVIAVGDIEMPEYSEGLRVRMTPRWSKGDSNPRSPGHGESLSGPYRSLLQRAGGGEVGTAVQPDFFCSASHSIEPGA